MKAEEGKVLMGMERVVESLLISGIRTCANYISGTRR
jgi:hypothetical protein